MRLKATADQNIETARDLINGRLAGLYDPVSGHWRSGLSDSAVATAVATFALSRIDPAKYASQVRSGLEWLIADQNPDGGWGDSPESPSNLSATLLAWSALSLSDDSPAVERAIAWLDKFLGDHAPVDIQRGIRQRYGGDLTFACPILTMCALAGHLGEQADAWQFVPQLPFEMAVMPHRCFRFLKLTVVSYALPALIGMGLARHTLRPSRCRGLRWLRERLRSRVLSIVEKMQPVNGGFEEAAPLVGFVAMSLAAAGHRDHRVVQLAADFLVKNQRDNGSWPIDTNLDTWVTVLAIQALTHSGKPGIADEKLRRRIGEWLLGQQYDEMHPLTFGAPGGWGWSDLPGAMPDADDTCGVLLALRRLDMVDENSTRAAARGIEWIMRLQNSDGGIPTFSRGWGKLPFDRSCPDITAHAIHAFVEWLDDVPQDLHGKMRRAMKRMMGYMHRSQTTEGGWSPLWFGTQQSVDERNLVYGTARAVLSLLAAGEERSSEMLARAIDYLLLAQQTDGGWGPREGIAAAVEEAALAVWALADAGESAAAQRGAQWLAQRVAGDQLSAGPIGLYFDRLWYAEQMYPLVFTAGALNAVSAHDAREEPAALAPH